MLLAAAVDVASHSLVADSTSPPPPQTDLVPVFGITVFENCPHEFLTEEYSESLKRFVTSEEHLAQNIANTEFKYQSSRSLRNDPPP